MKCAVGPGQCQNEAVRIVAEYPICVLHLFAFCLPVEARVPIHQACLEREEDRGT